MHALLGDSSMNNRETAVRPTAGCRFVRPQHQGRRAYHENGLRFAVAYTVWYLLISSFK